MTAAPQPAPTPPSGPSSGVGTPETAETGTGPREAGRLDRILVEIAQRPPELNQAATEALASPPSFAVQPGSAVDRLQAMVIALENECAALTDALTAVTHEFDPTPSTACEACFRPSAHPVHRTPARVRAELEER